MSEKHEDGEQGEGLLWRFEALRQLVRHEDPEVRAWAAGRLMHHYPERCPAVIVSLILDEPAGMAERVAEHLGRHGSAEHFPVLERAVRYAPERVPGACVDALGRLGHPGLEEVAAAGLARRDLGDDGTGLVLAALMRHAEPALGRKVALEVTAKRPAVAAEPAAARELFARLDPGDLPRVLDALLGALAWRGGEGAASVFLAIGEALETEDVGWLLHTNRRNRIDLRRTLKSYDATYDTETRARLGQSWSARLRAAFADGSLPAVAGVVLDYARGVAPKHGGGGDALPERILAVVEALNRPRTLEDVERIGPTAAEAAVVGFLSLALKLADYRSLRAEVAACRGDLRKLMRLAEVESSCLLEVLPQALEDAVADEEDREEALRFVAQMLGRRGPWYGKLIALDLVGRVQGVEEAHDVIRCLEDDNHYVLEAAGHALENLGPDGVAPLQAAYEDGRLDAESLEWLIAAICQGGSAEALSFILYHLDELVVELEAGFVCEWAALLGAEELIPRFRALLDADLVRVGHALLLVSAIHNRHVPEEERILQAIDHSQSEEPGPEGMEGGAGQGGGSYLM
ncbi:MAG: hypothetical protein PVF68_15715 [Acidobacteriota bacterium]|jgi:hypothetical protein